MLLLDAAGDAVLAGHEIADRIATDGLVRLREGTVGELRTVLAGWTMPVRHPHDREPGLTIITPDSWVDVVAGGWGFTRAPLPPHTDRSLQREAPTLVAAVMLCPSCSGGQALLVDGAEVIARLIHARSTRAVHGLRLRMPSGDAVPIFGFNDGLVRIRFRDDEVAGPWIDGEEDSVAALRAAITAATRAMPMAVGDGYIIHNHRYLHGRASFAGHRELARILATVTSARLTWLNEGFQRGQHSDSEQWCRRHEVDHGRLRRHGGSLRYFLPTK